MGQGQSGAVHVVFTDKIRNAPIQKLKILEE